MKASDRQTGGSAARGLSPARRSLGAFAPAGAAALALLLIALLGLAATAAADSQIGNGRGVGPGQFTALAGLGLSKQQGGDVYTTDMAIGQRVEQFEPNGAFVRAFGWGVVPGAATGTGTLTNGSNVIGSVTTTSGAFLSGMTIAGAGIPAGTRIVEVTFSGIELSNSATASGTGVPLSVAAGPGNVATNEVQKLTVRATAGEFKLSFTSPNPSPETNTTPALPFNAGSGEVQAALEGLADVGAGAVAVTGGPGDEKGTSPYRIEFRGRYADTNVSRLVPTGIGLAGGSPSSAATVETAAEGAAALEVCTTACGEGQEGSGPGQLRWSDALAIDNDPASASYGDVYVADSYNLRVEKFSPSGEFLLMFGGEVDKTTGADVCTAADVAGGDRCGAGVPGTAPSHFFVKEEEGLSGTYSWGNPGNHSIAVGPSGTVYVGDYGRVQEFEPDGAFAGELALPDSPTQFVTALAVDGSGNIFERSARYRENGGEALSEVPGVREYSSLHLLLRTFDTEEAGAEVTHIALDAAGDLFTSQFDGEQFSLRGFEPGGTLFAVFDSEEISPIESYGHVIPLPTAPGGIAIGDGVNRLYATSHEIEPQISGYRVIPHIAVVGLPERGQPRVLAGSETAADIEPTTATVHGTVNPEGFDTHYRFQYVTQAHFEAEGFANPEATSPVDAGALIQDHPVSAPLSGLSPSTRYHFRLFAENSAGTATGEDATFETLPAVSIRDFTTDVVGPELVTFRAELNPNGAPTEYTISYGPDANHEAGSASGTLPVGNEFVAIPRVTFHDLQPNTTYHYELVAENANGINRSGDLTFTTEPSAAEERAAESCSNTNLREANGSLRLPDCRAYEQVSPVEKGGYAVNPTSWLAPSGDRSLFFSGGTFAGATVNTIQNEYLAHRTASGWVTQPVEVNPAGEGFETTETAFDFNAELDRWLFPVKPGPSEEEAATANRGRIYLGQPGGQYSLASPDLSRVEGSHGQEDWFTPNGGAQDYSTYFIATGAKLLPSDPAPEGNGGSVTPDRLYRVSDVYGEPKLELFAEVPLPLIHKDGCFLDTTAVGREAPWASADGSIVYYSSPVAVEPALGCGSESPNKYQLFARVGTAPPIEVSAVSPTECSAPAPCATGAIAAMKYYGAAADGSRVWFATEQPLVNGDADVGESAATRDLYMAKLENGEVAELVQVTHGGPGDPAPGAGAGAVTLLELSADGTRAYFVATGVLTGEPNGEGETAAQGAENVYAYDSETRETRFVARLCTGPGKSGTASDAACPPGLSNSGEQGAQNDRLLLADLEPAGKQVEVTPDGRYLLFSSYAQLVPGDTDAGRDVYRYDLQTGQLTRVSIGRSGNDGNGNDSAFPASIHGIGSFHKGNGLNEAAGDASRAITDDGSQVVFSTAAALVSRDTNEATDVYEWEQEGSGGCAEAGGCVNLVSDGVDPQGALDPVISSSGRDIAFVSARNLVPEDHDGQRDVYDARLEGGFPFTPAKPPCGSPEACLPAPSPPPAPPVIASEGFQGGGNGPHQLACAKGKVRVKRHGQVRCVAKKRHRHAHHKKHKRALRPLTSRNGGTK